MTRNEDKVDLPVPLARLDMYNEAIIITKFENKSSTSYPVSVHDLATAFGTLPSSSGFLPKNTLFHGREGGNQFVGIYLEATKYVVTAGEVTMTIPLPAAIFIGSGKQYYIHALKQYPESHLVKLYKYPSPNVFLDGRVCSGNTPFPVCNVKTIMSAWKLFLISQFNRHLSDNRCRSFPDNVIKLWETLDGQEQFPLSELVPSATNLRNWV